MYNYSNTNSGDNEIENEKKVVFLKHAIIEMERRSISKELVTDTINNHEKTIPQKNERTLYQKKYFDNDLQKDMLMRVITEKKEDDLLVVTAYKTSKIAKYTAGEKK